MKAATQPTQREIMRGLFAQQPILRARELRLHEGHLVADELLELLELLRFSLSAYPLDLLAASIVAQRAALEGLREGAERRDDALPFDEMQEAVGFGEYYREEARYK